MSTGINIAEWLERSETYQSRGLRGMKNEEFYNLKPQTPDEIEMLIVIWMLAEAFYADRSEDEVDISAGDFIVRRCLPQIQQMDPDVDAALLSDCIDRGRSWNAWLVNVTSKDGCTND